MGGLIVMTKERPGSGALHNETFKAADVLQRVSPRRTDGRLSINRVEIRLRFEP